MCPKSYPVLILSRIENKKLKSSYIFWLKFHLNLHNLYTDLGSVSIHVTYAEVTVLSLMQQSKVCSCPML